MVTQITSMIGQIFTSVVRKDWDSDRCDQDELIFSNDKVVVTFTHFQDCCEAVYIEDINGDLNDLIGVPITQAEETIEESRDDGYDDGATWTFYKFATVKGYVTVRWCGTSNGYYSESVDMTVTKVGE